jgi:hypothetical protein
VSEPSTGLSSGCVIASAHLPDHVVHACHVIHVTRNV